MISPVAAAAGADAVDALVDGASGVAFAGSVLEVVATAVGVDTALADESSDLQLPARLYPAASASSALLNLTWFFSDTLLYPAQPGL